MARMTPKEIGVALELENEIQHDLLVDESEREAWQDYQDGLSCDGSFDDHDIDWFDDGGPDYYDPYPYCDDDYGWLV